jgi:aminodeoxychorismate lyase
VLVFLNGRFVPEARAVVSVFDRGFLYGDGLFETIRVSNGRPFRWLQHWERLRQGAKFLKIKLPYTPDQLLAFADKLITKNKMPDSLLRISVSRGVGTPGYLPQKANRPTLIMSLRPSPKISRKIPAQWKLIVSSFQLMAGDPLAQYKTANKLPQILARTQASADGADEALLANSDDFVVEGASSNLFWVRRGVICTPPLVAGILPGVTRALVFEIAAGLNIPVRQQNIRVQDLARMDGVFLSLTSLGIIEAKTLDRKILRKSPVTGSLAQVYNEMLMNSSACNPGRKR